MRSSICLAAILLSGVATEALAQQTSESTSSNGMKLHIGAGTSALFLPDVKFTTLTNGIVTEYRGQLTDLSGRVDGTRLDLGLEGIPLGHALTFGVKGFFADMSASNSAECTADLKLIQPMCIYLPFWDPDKYIQGDFAGFVTSDWEIRTERRVQNWGLALELQPRQVHTVGSLKDEPVEVVKPSPWRLGLAARGIDENISLDAYDPQDPVHLRESINTGYYGAYIGYANAVRLTQSLSFGLNGEIGVYYARTNFKGRYEAEDPYGGLAFGGPLTSIHQTLDLSQSRAAAIASIGANLTQDFGGGVSLGLTAQGDWYSYVPVVHHNNTDWTPSPHLDLVGTNDGTSLGDAGAFAYTLGGRVTIKMSN